MPDPDPRRAGTADFSMNMPPEPDDPALLARMREGLVAVSADLPIFTTISELSAAVGSLSALRSGFTVTSLQEYNTQRGDS